MKQSSPFASVSPGRVRLRHPLLRNHDLRERMQESLKSLAEVETNPATGSLLLRFDPTDTEREALIRAEVAAVFAEAGAPEAGPAATPCVPAPAPHAQRRCRRQRAQWEVNRAAKLGALASMAVSLAALASSRKLHAQAGVLSVALMLIHVAVHRRHVLR